MKADKKTIAAVVLGILAVGVIVYQVTGSLSPSKSAVNAAVAPQTTVAKATVQPAAVAQAAQASLTQDNYDSLIASVSEKDLAYRDPAFRDPMSPLIPDPKALKLADIRTDDSGIGPIDAVAMGYSIQGIIWNKVAPLALINNQVVGVGEALDDGSRVTEITADTAKFTKKGKNYFLVFREE